MREIPEESDQSLEGVCMKAVSILSGDFPSCSDYDDIIPSTNQTDENENPPSLLKKMSTVSLSETEIDEADSEMLTEYIQYCWSTKSPPVYSKNTKHTIDEEECERVMNDMLRDKSLLQRILKARKFQLEASTLLFFEQVRFRARYHPPEIQPIQIPNALPSGAWRLCGYSKEGCIMSNFKLEFWNPTYDVEEYTLYVLFMLEQMIQQMRPPPHPQKFVLIFDLKGFTPSLVFQKKVRAMIVKLIYIAQAQYPERLGKCILVNPPFGFESAWKLIRSVLDGNTASKIRFCFKMSDLLEDVDASVLPVEYGGTCEEYSLPGSSL